MATVALCHNFTRRTTCLSNDPSLATVLRVPNPAAKTKGARSNVASPARKRRTQAERRAAARAALLEAAIESLAEDGYSGLTTRGVARRAGVSQGAWLHYFPTKSQFLIEAMRYASEKIAIEVLQNVDPTRLREDPTAREEILDEIWRIHTSPEFQAALELWIAARKDAELCEGLRKLEREVTSIIGTAAEKAVGGVSPGTGLIQLIDIGLATIRGFAMLPPVTSPRAVETRWRAAKEYLLAVYDAHVAGRL